MMKVGVPRQDQSQGQESNRNKRQASPRSPLATSQLTPSNVAPAFAAAPESSSSSVGEVAGAIVDCALEVAGAVVESIPLTEIAGGIVEVVAEAATSIFD